MLTVALAFIHNGSFDLQSLLWLRLFALLSCQRVREHSSCQTWRVECVKTMPLQSLLTIPSSQRQKLVSLSRSFTHPITHVFSVPHTQSLSWLSCILCYEHVLRIVPLPLYSAVVWQPISGGVSASEARCSLRRGCVTGPGRQRALSRAPVRTS